MNRYDMLAVRSWIYGQDWLTRTHIYLLIYIVRWRIHDARCSLPHGRDRAGAPKPSPEHTDPAFSSLINHMAGCKEMQTSWRNNRGGTHREWRAQELHPRHKVARGGAGATARDWWSSGGLLRPWRPRLASIDAHDHAGASLRPCYCRGVNQAGGDNSSSRFSLCISACTVLQPPPRWTDRGGGGLAASYKYPRNGPEFGAWMDLAGEKLSGRWQPSQRTIVTMKKLAGWTHESVYQRYTRAADKLRYWQLGPENQRGRDGPSRVVLVQLKCGPTRKWLRVRQEWWVWRPGPRCRCRATGVGWRWRLSGPWWSGLGQFGPWGREGALSFFNSFPILFSN